MNVGLNGFLNCVSELDLNIGNYLIIIYNLLFIINIKTFELHYVDQVYFYVICILMKLQLFIETCGDLLDDKLDTSDIKYDGCKVSAYITYNIKL